LGGYFRFLLGKRNAESIPIKPLRSILIEEADFLLRILIAWRVDFDNELIEIDSASSSPKIQRQQPR
jgi:hypothetical protein